MNRVFSDECLQNLYCAQETMKNWIPLSDYEMIFEAVVNPDVKSKIVQNEETGKKSIGFVQKAIQAVQKLIRSIIEKIQDFIDKLTMAGPERAEYERFKASIKNDPKLKNKRVSVRDFRKITNSYDSLLAEVEDEMRKVKNNPDHPIDGITKKVSDFISGAATASAVIVATDVALKIADSNIEMAEQIRKALNEEEQLMSVLSKNLGKRDANKFKKEIDAAAKNTFLHQCKVKLFRHKYDTLQGCIQGTMDAFTHVGLDTLVMGKRLLKNPYTGTAIKTTVKTVAAGEYELAKQKHGAKKQQKELAKMQQHLDKESRKPVKTDGVHKPKNEFLFGK